MRVVFLTETCSPQMGYLGSTLPRVMSSLGAEVHVVTMGLPPYHYLPEFDATLGSFLTSQSLAPGLVETGPDGVTLHVLPHRRVLGYVRMVGMQDKLRALEPNIVQTGAAIGWIPLDALRTRLALNFRLFTGSHTTASTFALARDPGHFWDSARLRCFATRTVPGRAISLATEKCYAPTVDCAEIAWRFFGVQRGKVEIMHLGVETDLFYPAASAASLARRKELRDQLGIGADDILAIYTGKLTEEKNALILAEAIERLRSAGLPFRGLFIGEGPQRAVIATCPHSVALDFMPYLELPDYYRAADVGVWPTTESTSMLDAAASGLPLIISDRVVYRDHVDGNGLVFRDGHLAALVEALRSLVPIERRRQLGARGATKMATSFSLQAHAQQRMADYERSLAGRPPVIRGGRVAG